jgi:hypothetical protein
VERSNGMILQELKPRTFDRLNPCAEKWVKELPSILWTLRTTRVMLRTTHREGLDKATNGG